MCGGCHHGWGAVVVVVGTMAVVLEVEMLGVGGGGGEEQKGEEEG